MTTRVPMPGRKACRDPLNLSEMVRTVHQVHTGAHAPQPQHRPPGYYAVNTNRRVVRAMHGRFSMIHGALLATLFAGVTLGSPPSPGSRIPSKTELQPPPLSVLARHLASTEPDQQWEFAAITLDVLLDIYARELQMSAHDKASTQARRAKLARWQHATQGLIGQIQDARTKLGQGAQFSIYVDTRHQILIIIEGQAVVVSGPRAGVLEEIAAPVLEQYCAYNDCSILQTSSTLQTPTDPKTKGTWVFHQRMRPAYEIGNELRCEFDNLADRSRKAQLCDQLADELLQLAKALQDAANEGYIIDWEMLAASPPNAERNTHLVVNREGAYLQTELQLLSRVTVNDWQDVLDWLQHRHQHSHRQLIIVRTERFF